MATSGIKLEQYGTRALQERTKWGQEEQQRLPESNLPYCFNMNTTHTHTTKGSVKVGRLFELYLILKGQEN